MSASSDSRLLSAVEAAEALGVSVDTLARWRIAGTGPAYVKLGRAKQATIRYRRVDLERFIGEGLRQSTSDEGGAR